MFFGYPSYKVARKFWPRQILEKYTVTKLNVCSNNKGMCIGGMHDETGKIKYLYENGEPDYGREIRIFTVVVSNKYTIKWS